MRKLTVHVRLTDAEDWIRLFGPTASEQDAVDAAEAILFTTSALGRLVSVQIRNSDDTVWRKDSRDFRAHHHQRMRANVDELFRLRRSLAMLEAG